MDHRTVHLSDVSLAVVEAGTGGRPRLLVHGFTGAGADFADHLDALAADGWHAVAPDLRGHGSSSRPDDEAAYSFGILADDVVALVDALGWDRYVLLGHSMGGMVAQLVALADPGRLDGLVLMDTSHGPVAGLEPDAVAAAVGIVRSRGIDRLAELLEAAEGPLSTPSHRRLLAERPGYAEFGRAKFRATSPALYAAMAPSFLTVPDRLDALATLPADLPVLVLVGDEDAPFLGPSERMAAAIPGAALAVVPGAGHSPQFEHPDAWWAALSGFLAGLTAGSPPVDRR